MSRYDDFDQDSSGSCCSSLCMCIFLGVLVGALWVGPLVSLKTQSDNGQLDKELFRGIFYWCLGLNIGTFVTNVIDKGLAICFSERNCVVRVPEVVLHFLTLLGGAPGTVLAMLVVCHKCSKNSYRKIYVICASISIICLAAAYSVIVIQQLKNYSMGFKFILTFITYLLHNAF